MKIEAGKFYRLRDGLKARIYATDGARQCPIHGSYFSEGQWHQGIWDASGAYSSSITSSLDIVSEWREPRRYEAWMNVYVHRCPVLFHTKEDADRCAGGDRIACIHLTGEG